MSEILLRWLNEELPLSAAVLNLEEDLRNGFLLGQVLAAHNQQPDFALFRNGQAVETIVRNFCLLEPTFRRLKIDFNAQTALDVIGAKKGAVDTLLYQVKMVVDRLGKFAEPVSDQMEATTGVRPLPNMPARPTKEKYDKAAHSLFEAALRRTLESQNSINMKRVLQRFEVEGMRQAAQQKRDKQLELEAMEQYTRSVRERAIRDLLQRRALSAAWDQKNVDKWMEGKALVKEKEAARRRFLNRQARRRRERVERARRSDQREVAGLEEFNSWLMASTRTETVPTAISAPAAAVPMPAVAPGGNEEGEPQGIATGVSGGGRCGPRAHAQERLRGREPAREGLQAADGAPETDKKGRWRYDAREAAEEVYLPARRVSDGRVSRTGDGCPKG